MRLCKLKPVSEISPYFNDSFKKWVEENQNKTFKILNEVGNSYQLAKVGFWVSKDCVKEIE